jgi:hypothetical protein
MDAKAVVTGIVLVMIGMVLGSLATLTALAFVQP